MDSLDLTSTSGAADRVVRVALPREAGALPLAAERRGLAEFAVVHCGSPSQVDEVLQRYGPDGWEPYTAVRCAEDAIELTLVRDPD